MPRSGLHPGAQFNIFRATIATEFARVVLHELVTSTASLDNLDALTGDILADLVRDGSGDFDLRELIECDVYDQKHRLEKIGGRLSATFNKLAFSDARNNEGSGAPYRLGVVNAVEITRHVTGVFPDLTCNHTLEMALESVICWLIVTQGQDAAHAYVQAALLNAMPQFFAAHAQRRGALPNGTPTSPLIP